ncbi:MAG: hypothetical protein EZS28_012235, partial [Streblomastix strix]
RIIPEVWLEAQKLNIDVFCIAAHSSTIMQPLDRGCNAEFKV